MVATTPFFTGAAVLLAAAGPVTAYTVGSAIIHNECPFEVYLWSISDVNSPMQSLAADGGEYSETYQINPDGGGISIKIGSSTNGQNITQFEYTLVDDALWYDLSNINGYPFADYGVTVVPSDSSCRGVSCPAGASLCAAAYNVPSDNFATAECEATADTVVVLCSGETDTSGSASVSSIASVAASTAAPVSVFTSTVAATSAVAPSTTVVVSTVETSTVAKPSSTTEEVTSTKATTHHHHTEVVKVESTSTTAAPAVVTEAAVTEAAVINNPYVVVQTTFITHVITVEARSPQPTAAAEAKRDTHHEHAAVHQEHPVRRHQHPRAFAVAA